VVTANAFATLNDIAPGRLLLGILMIVVSTVLGLVQPYLLGEAIDALGNKRPQGDVLAIAGEMLVLAVLLSAVTFAMRYTLIGLSRIIEYELRSDLFAHLQEMEHSFYQNMHTGDIMARATNDTVVSRLSMTPPDRAAPMTPSATPMTTATPMLIPANSRVFGNRSRTTCSAGCRYCQD